MTLERVQKGGEKYLGFARRKLAQLRALRLDIGVPALSKALKVGASVILLKSTEWQELIHITAGALVDYLYTFISSSSSPLDSSFVLPGPMHLYKNTIAEMTTAQSVHNRVRYDPIAGTPEKLSPSFYQKAVLLETLLDLGQIDEARELFMDFSPALIGPILTPAQAFKFYNHPIDGWTWGAGSVAAPSGLPPLGSTADARGFITTIPVARMKEYFESHEYKVAGVTSGGTDTITLVPQYLGQPLTVDITHSGASWSSLDTAPANEGSGLVFTYIGREVTDPDTLVVTLEVRGYMSTINVDATGEFAVPLTLKDVTLPPAGSSADGGTLFVRARVHRSTRGLDGRYYYQRDVGTDFEKLVTIFGTPRTDTTYYDYQVAHECFRFDLLDDLSDFSTTTIYTSVPYYEHHTTDITSLAGPTTRTYDDLDIIYYSYDYDTQLFGEVSRWHQDGEVLLDSTVRTTPVVKTAAFPESTYDSPFVSIKVYASIYDMSATPVDTIDVFTELSVDGTGAGGASTVSPADFDTTRYSVGYVAQQVYLNTYRDVLGIEREFSVTKGTSVGVSGGPNSINFHTDTYLYPRIFNPTAGTLFPNHREPRAVRKLPQRTLQRDVPYLYQTRTIWPSTGASDVFMLTIDGLYGDAEGYAAGCQKLRYPFSTFFGGTSESRWTSVISSIGTTGMSTAAANDVSAMKASMLAENVGGLPIDRQRYWANQFALKFLAFAKQHAGSATFTDETKVWPGPTTFVVGYVWTDDVFSPELLLAKLTFGGPGGGPPPPPPP